jgi:hypothetical protein
MKDNSINRSDNDDNISPIDSEYPGTTSQPLLPKKVSRVCFIITRNRQDSWVDDLHACEQLRKGDTVFH